MSCRRWLLALLVYFAAVLDSWGLAESLAEHLARGHVTSRNQHQAEGGATVKRIEFPGSNSSLPPVMPRHCVARHGTPATTARGDSRPPASSSRVDVVLAVCVNLEGEFLRKLKCEASGVRARFLVYHICRPVEGPQGSQPLRQIQNCLAGERAGVSDAEAAVLEHVLSHRDGLSSMTIFAAVSEVPSVEALMRAISAAAEAAPAAAYLGFPTKPPPLPRPLPPGACRLIQRYACLEACSAEGLRAMERWPAQKVFFAASADRLRSLDVHEYQWLRARHHLSEGLWPFLLGCPEAVDAAPGDSPAICRQPWAFGSGADRSKPTDLVAASKEMHPEQLRVLPQECVARDLSATQAPSPGSSKRAGPRVGIVLVHCDENLSTLQSMPCNATDPEAVLYIFSKCGVDEAKTREQMGENSWRCVRSFRTVPVTLETELAWTKHHREYLEFIISRYYSFEPVMMFIKANFHKRHLNVSDMIRDAVDNHWAFKSYGGPKRPVDLERFPENGNSRVWREEMCAMYRRYACIDICTPEKDLEAAGVPVPLYNTRSMWIASSTRIRSLRLTEYQWWREYISNVPQEAGVTRRYMLERLWQVLLGCPEEHYTTDVMGCRHSQAHPRGQAVAPPPELLLAGSNSGDLQASRFPLVNWPQPSREEFNADVPYSNFLAIADRSNHPEKRSADMLEKRITFVMSLGIEDNHTDRHEEIMRATAVAAARFHPNCRFVLLADEGSGVALPQFWSHRMELQLRPRGAGHPDSLWGFGRRHQRRNSWMDLQLWFLQKIAADPSEMNRFGHLVMTDARMIPVAPLWDAFEIPKADSLSVETGPGESRNTEAKPPFSVAVIYAPPAVTNPLGTKGIGNASCSWQILSGTWFVPQGVAADAAKLLEAVAASAMQIKAARTLSWPFRFFRMLQRQKGGSAPGWDVAYAEAWRRAFSGGCTTPELSNIKTQEIRERWSNVTFTANCQFGRHITQGCSKATVELEHHHEKQQLEMIGRGESQASLSVQMLPCALWQASLGGDRVEICPVLNPETRAIQFAHQEVSSHLTAVLRIKDKSNGLAALKTSVLQLLKFHGKELSPRLLKHYLQFLNSTDIRSVWMPPEKRGPPTVGPIPKKRNNKGTSSTSYNATQKDSLGHSRLTLAERLFLSFQSRIAGLL